MATTGHAHSGPAERYGSLAFPAPKAAECPFDPAPAIDEVRRREPITRATLWDGTSCWLVTGHEHIRQVLSSPNISAEATHPGFPFLVAGVRELVRTMKPTFFRQDDPEHARLGRMLTTHFTVKKVTGTRRDIQRLTDELIDRMIDGRTSADLVAEFALPLPSVVICLMLGVPYADCQFFQERSAMLFSLTATAQEVRTSQEELLGYLAKIAEAKRQDPDDSVISYLANRDDMDVEAVASTGRLLLVAGHETTAKMISLSALALLRNPDQAARLREQPSLIEAAVEALLRYLTIVHSGMPRVAIGDVRVGDHVIRDGEAGRPQMIIATSI